DVSGHRLRDRDGQVPRGDGPVRRDARGHACSSRGALYLRTAGVEADSHVVSRTAAVRRLFRGGGPVHFESVEKPDRGRVGDVRDFPAAVVINWIGSFAGPTGEKVKSFLSIVDHFDDFSK